MDCTCDFLPVIFCDRRDLALMMDVYMFGWLWRLRAKQLALEKNNTHHRADQQELDQYGKSMRAAWNSQKQ